MVAFRRGFREAGAVDGTFGVFNTLMDSKSLFLTANSDTVYAFTWIDLSKGPVVIESAPNTLGIVDDFWFRYVADLGNAGPDKGKGGKYLFLPLQVEDVQQSVLWRWSAASRCPHVVLLQRYRHHSCHGH
jgi:hypothetical protein